MPSLFIDGQWVASGDGTCAPVVNPSDGSLVTEVDVATDDQVQAAIAAARRAFDTTDWPRTPTGGSRRAARPRRRPARPRPGGARHRGDAEHRQGDAREPLGHGRRRQGLPLLRRPRRQGGRPPRRREQPVDLQPDRVRAGRRLRAHRAVELPAPPAELEDRAGARGGQHGGHEAGVGDAAHGDPPDPPPRGGRASRPGSSTSSSARATGSARRSPTARTSTSSR